MPLFLVRHGETRLSGTFCGSSNPPLNAHGRAQAAAAARCLSRFSFDYAYISPLRRVQETAAIIRHRSNVSLVTRLALREIHFGIWEGRSFQEIDKKSPGLSRRWLQDPTTVRIPQAESFASLRRRTRRFLSVITPRMVRENVLVVAHGGTNSAIILQLLGLPDTEFRKQIQPLASVRMIDGRKMKTLC